MNGTIIAFSGKGGSGKTSLSSMLIRELVRTGKKPVLAVDADPNATLGLTLGIEEGKSIADLRDLMSEAAQNPSEISKDRLMDMYLAELLSEQEGFDLLTMGRPEGPKCYCYINGLLRRYLSILRKNYAYIIVDCEAGMEYLSRLVVDDVETIVLVAQESPVGLTTAQRIVRLVDSLPIRVHQRLLVLNRMFQGNSDGQVIEMGSSLSKEVDGMIRVPFDADLFRRCSEGRAVDDQAGPEARKAIEELARCCLNSSSDK